MATQVSAERPRRRAVDIAKDRLLAMISDQGLVSGDKLDPEPRLAETLGVSRSTVREAFRLLENDGVVTAIQGHGRFVSAVGALEIDRPMTQYESLTEMLVGLGYEVTTTVLDVSEAAANESESAALRIEVGAPVIRLTRLRFGDGRPMVVNRNTILREALPGPVAYRDWSGSLSSALEAHGHHLVLSSARISAADLPESLESRFGLGGLGPWLLVRETSVSVSGLRVVCAEDYHTKDISFSVLRRR